jgi:hypothetical protein
LTYPITKEETMNAHSCWKTLPIFSAIVSLMAGFWPAQIASAQTEEFPQKNVWTRSSPSVVWCGDPASTTTLEVHIVGRNDVARVWLTDLGTSGEDARGELFDDGTHGDVQAGDNVYTLADVILNCNSEYLSTRGGIDNWWGFLRVELKDGTPLENNYGMVVGLVNPEWKNAFPVHDFGNGLSATQYAFFIQDTDHKVMDNYPIATVYCGTNNYNAYRKLYSVLPDVFDFALVMPGMQIFRPKDLAENVPYDVTVANSVRHIGMNIFDRTAKFGSAGRLRAVIYHSFGDIAIMDHEMGHAWGVDIGQTLGLMDVWNGTPMLGHWNDMADIQGQMGYYYFDDNGNVGHFAYNGDETWRLVTNTEVEPYSPLELYLMGMIPPDEVPPVHILQNPDLSNLNRITAASYKTVTIDQIMQAEGGPRLPISADAQKDFTLAFIVTQDVPFNDAAYAYFSLMSHKLMSKSPPLKFSYFAPFYWATGGRGTLDTRLPVDVTVTDYLPGDPTFTPEPTAIIPTATPTLTPKPTAIIPTVIPTDIPIPTAQPAARGSPFCGSAFIAGGMALILGIWRYLKKPHF